MKTCDYIYERRKRKQNEGTEREIVNIYGKDKFLGRGGFAKVYEVYRVSRGISSRIHSERDSKRERWAVKIIPKRGLIEGSIKQLNKEIMIHKQLHHPHIVEYWSSFEDSRNVYILMELCENQSMVEYMKQKVCLTEVEAAQFLLQIISAVEYIHSKNVIHRDLKLANLLLSNQNIKISDFGFAFQIENEVDSGRPIAVCGTPNYIAPEVLNKTTGYSFEIDIWAIGVILYTMLIGTPPFETLTVETTYLRIMEGSYTFPPAIEISPQATTLIQRTLVVNPNERITLQEMRSHEFLKGVLVKEEEK